MEKQTIYWTMKDGRKISVDDMDVNHLRNTLKMIIRNINRNESKAIASKPKFEIHGEIAREQIESAMIEEIMGDLMDDYYNQF
jgi:hypothetical protein